MPGRRARKARRERLHSYEQLELLAAPEGAGSIEDRPKDIPKVSPSRNAGDPVSRRASHDESLGADVRNSGVRSAPRTRAARKTSGTKVAEKTPRTRAARGSKARSQAAATATTDPERPKVRHRPRWGDVAALLLVFALFAFAVYNQGLWDRAVAWVRGETASDVGETGPNGQPDTAGTQGETGSTGASGSSGETGSTGASGSTGESGQSGDPSDAGNEEIETVLAPIEMALSARALYLTMDTAGTPSRMASIMQYMRAHEGLNSFVIDIKDNSGRVPAKPPEHVPARAGSYSQLPGLIQILADLDYYMIARIVAFQDPYRAQQEPERAIRGADGSLWRDRDGRLWLNPYDEKNWEFVRDIALWAVDMGFHEIQLDYVRFPDSARGLEGSGTVLMPGSEKYETRGDCIAAFLDYMSEALKGKAYLGADIFGFATIASDDMGIGHKWEQLADSVDFMCPMVYPSHYYNAGIYGFQVPEAHPYEVVYKAMAEALERSEGLRGKTRPWLQDFSMRIKYGPEEVSGQIRAAFEHGIQTYMLWNPANNYTDGVEYTPEVEVSDTE